MNNKRNTTPSTDTSEWEKNLSQRDKRALIFHILYIAESFDYQQPIQIIIDNLNRGFNLNILPNSSIVHIAEQIIIMRDQLDAIYQPFLANWRLERLTVCTKLILRFAVWELACTDTIETIIINEAVELAKCFAEQNSYKFINGVLDQIARKRETIICSSSNLI